jgi:hypothetical protein
MVTQTPPAAANRQAVTVDNFVRAESDRVFAGFCPQGFGKFVHHRELSSIEHQLVQRGNRDTLYSFAVLDLDAGPATITLPDAGRRLMSLTVFSQDHYTRGSVYGASSHVVRKEDRGGAGGLSEDGPRAPSMTRLRSTRQP